MPPAVDVRDRAAAGADRVHVDHRDHRLVRPDLRVEQVLHAQPPVLRETDVGRRAADVERDHVVVARLPPGPDAADDPCHRAGHEQRHRSLDRRLGRGDPGGRGHQVQSRAHPEPLELLLEPRHVRGDLRADVRVQAHGREALVLAVLRDHLGRDREERLGELLAHDLRHPLLVRRVQEREQEADAHRLDPGLLERPHLLARPHLVERDEHGAVALDPLRNGQPVASPNDRVALPGEILVVREVERLLVARDVEDVSVALRRDHPDRRPGVLDHDVRRDRRPVEHLVELRRVDARLRGQLADAPDRPERRILRCGRELVHPDHPGLVIDIDQVGERAPDVDTHTFHGLVLLGLRA